MSKSPHHVGKIHRGGPMHIPSHKGKDAMKSGHHGPHKAPPHLSLHALSMNPPEGYEEGPTDNVCHED